MLTIKLPAQIANLGKWISPVSGFLRGYGLSHQKIIHIELALEEALVNVCRYAYGQIIGDIELHCQKMDHHQYLIEIIDSGAPFDVCDLPEPDVKACIAVRKVGGLGVHILRRMVDQVSYRREGDKNILSLFFQALPEQNTGTTPCQSQA